MTESWLRRQVRAAKEEVEQWPEWMKKAAHFEGFDRYPDGEDRKGNGSCHG